MLITPFSHAVYHVVYHAVDHAVHHAFDHAVHLALYGFLAFPGVALTRKVRVSLVVLASLIAALYAAAVGYLAFNETALVYVSAGRETGRFIPDDTLMVPWDTTRVVAADGVPVFLLTTRIDTSSRRPWILFFHGNAGFVGSRGNVQRYRLFRDAGFNVVAVEYRGYGRSRSVRPPNEAGLRADAAAGLEYLTRTLRIPPKRIVAYGHSLGGGVAAYVGAESGIGAIVTEGTFTTLPDVGAARYTWVPVRLVMRNRFDNLSRARSVAVPWIVLHGRPDDEIPFTHAEALVGASSRMRLIPLEGGHDDAALEDRETSLAVLRDLARDLSAAESGRP